MSILSAVASMVPLMTWWPFICTQIGGGNYQTKKFPKKLSSNIITSLKKFHPAKKTSVEPFQANERSSNSSLGIIVICPLPIHIAINIVKVVYDILSVC